MAITYEWHLNNVDIQYIPDTNDAQITRIHWGCSALDEDTQTLVDAVGVIDVTDENYVYPASTIKNTTKTQVFQWLNNKLGDEKDEIKANLATELAEKLGKDYFTPID